MLYYNTNIHAQLYILLVYNHMAFHNEKVYLQTFKGIVKLFSVVSMQEGHCTCSSWTLLMDEYDKRVLCDCLSCDCWGVVFTEYPPDLWITMTVFSDVHNSLGVIRTLKLGLAFWGFLFVFAFVKWMWIH